MLRFCLLTLGFFSIFCINLKHSAFTVVLAQTFPVPSTPGAPIINISPSATPSPFLLPGTGLPPIALPTSQDKSKRIIIKYSEFKSICIQPELEKIALSDLVKEKRIMLIQEKLNKSESVKDTAATRNIKTVLIKELLKQGSYGKAEALFKIDGVQFSESDQVIISADIDINKNLYRQAKDNLNKFLETHPKDILALEKLTAVYTLLNRYTEARMVLEDLSKINLKKDYTEALCENSVLNADHLYVKNYCQKLLKKNSKNPLPYIYLGISNRDQEQYPEAIKNFKLSLKIKPTEFASTCLAETYFLSKLYDQSLKQYQESILIKPDSPRAHLGLANTYVRNNQYREALDEFKVACQLGLRPLFQMSTTANLLKSQKSDLADSYFNEMQICRK